MQELIKLFEVITKDNPKELANALLQEIIQFSKAKSGAVYFLNISKNTFDKRFCYQADSWKSAYTLSEISQEKHLGNVISEAHFFYEAEKTLIIPIIRKTAFKNFTIGFIHLGEIHLTDPDSIQFLQLASGIFDHVIKDIFLENLLVNGNHPLSFKKSKDDYFNDLILLITDASQMPYIILREYDDENDELFCLGTWGFDPKMVPEYKDNEIPEIYRQVITNKKSLQGRYHEVVDGAGELHYSNVHQYLALPIIVGDTFWGILTLATQMDYYFIDSEILGFETLSHGIGISINNFRNFQIGNTKTIEAVNNATLITGLEIAQAVRHEAKNLLNESQSKLLLLHRVADKKGKEDVEYLSRKLKDVLKSLDKIRTATKPPTKVLSRVNIREVWDRSVDMLRGRLEEQDIHVKYTGSGGIIINAFSDWLMHAFMNLITNSYDAYKERANKKNREITLSVTDGQDKVQLIYTDNAGGIEIQNLAIPDSISEEEKKDINRFIFMPNVTSKGDKGSGYGLYLTRATLQDYHKGSINLTNYRNGVTFAIEISKNL